MWRCCCSECLGSEHDGSYPVKVIVFDFDETLTMVTFTQVGGTILDASREYLLKLNFESPFVEGSRLDKLRKMLSELQYGKNGLRRRLAILSKNSGGVQTVVNMLQIAELTEYFSAIWIMPFNASASNGMYFEKGRWKSFEPPLREVENHKADILQHISEHPVEWFPQIAGQDAAEYRHLRELKLEGIVLVDDQRDNFHSDSGARVLRACKIARYDSDWYDLGMVRNMGGIGAHSDADYWTLLRFVQDPWLCKETHRIRCLERDFVGDEARHPIKLVVIDFDETLTLATFMPDEEGLHTTVGWTPRGRAKSWSNADLITYNFESPWVKGHRIAKLMAMLKILKNGKNGLRRSLAILTKNERGVVAVLNLLMLAKLDEHFSAIWTIPSRASIPNGAYREGGKWKLFHPPVDKVHNHKCDVLRHVVENPTMWFPQLLREGGPAANPELFHLMPESIALVDDERANSRSDSPSQAIALRFCKVARYDEVYRDCGLLNQMGGLGAHSDADYATLQSFVEAPWEYPYESDPHQKKRKQLMEALSPSSVDGLELVRSCIPDECGKVPRERSYTKDIINHNPNVVAIVATSCLRCVSAM